MYHAIKQEIDLAIKGYLESELSGEPEFSGDNQTSFFERQGVEDLTHPSVLNSCEEAPIIQDEMQIHKMCIEVFVTSPMLDMNASGTEIDANATHTQRVAIVEDLLMDRAALNTYIAANHPNLIIHDESQIGDPVGMQSDAHWVDKATIYIHGQLLTVAA